VVAVNKHAVKTYDVEIFREGRWWIAVVPGVRGAVGQYTRLSQIEADMREGLAFVLDTPEDKFDIAVTVKLEPASQRAVDGLAVAEARLAEALEARDAARFKAIETLSYLADRDVGELMGISYQRVAQLRAEAAALAKAKPTATPAKRARPGKAAKPAAKKRAAAVKRSGTASAKVSSKPKR
jgi:hypothetical protein